MTARNLAQITSVVGPVNNPVCPTLTAVCTGQAHTDQSVVAAYTLGTWVEWPQPEAQHSLSLPSLKFIYIQLVRHREHPRLHYGDQPVTACLGEQSLLHATYEYTVWAECRVSEC
jgi:hypothetical protein